MSMIRQGTPMWAVHCAGAAGLVALTAGVALLGVRPAMRRADEVRTMFTSINERDREVREAEQGAISTSKINEGLGEELSRAVRLIPASKINDRLAELTARADGKGVTVEQISPGTPAGAPKYTAVPIKMSGNCTYAGATRFLRELRGEFRDMAVSSLTITGQPGKAGEKATYTVEFVWYAAPAGSAVAAGQ